MNDRPATTVRTTPAIVDRVLEVARTDPDRVAIVHAHADRRGRIRYVEHTYGELSDRAERLAVGLREVGIRERTRCSFMVPPSFDALVLGVALFRVGATIVGIEPFSHGFRRVTRCLARVGPEAFFGTPQAHLARTLFGWGRESIEDTFVVGGRWPGARRLEDLADRPHPGEPAAPDVGPDDVATVAFTTGSTGTPKPTVLRHRNFHAMVDLIGDRWELGDGRDVVDMPTFPMFWIIALSAGGQVVVPPMDFTRSGPGDADAGALLRVIQERGVTSMFGSPALLGNLAAHAREHGTTTPTLRRIVAGGAEVLGPLYEQVRAFLPADGELYSNYGATEALPLTEIAGATVLGETWSATLSGEGLCVGDPLAGVELRIIEPTDGPIETLDEATVLPDGEVGEVIARSPHVSEDYFRDPVATAANKIADGETVWHRLGDTGYLDDQGRLWVCGRVSHQVVTSDRTYRPLQVEPVVASHPSVHRAALVGLPRDGEPVPVVCVELVPGATIDASTLDAELRALTGRHAATAGLERFLVVDKLPVDARHNAKIDRPGLAVELDGDRRTRSW